MPKLLPEKQRAFAVEVVARLRDAGFTAYLAGGCVRDRLLGKVPKDYDVATDARPKEIRRVFRDRKTLAVGAAFGTITVVGPYGAGQVEVTTFRRDAAYSDGRHPDSVTFSSAEEDASRRDFTINGLFLDPLSEQVIDHVGGQEDLRRRLVRAIGDPHARIAEDKLRMLRAVRFAAVMGFELEEGTLVAVRQMADELILVSAERIAAEMARVLVDPHRAAGVRLLIEARLARGVLPELLDEDDAPAPALARRLAVLERLREPGFALALAALLSELVDAGRAEQVCWRWRLSNPVTDRTKWLVARRGALAGAPTQPWSVLQPVLIHPGAHDLVALGEAEAAAGLGDSADVEYCRRILKRPRDQIDPPPLVTGNDLKALGIPSGPAYGRILQRLRDAQLDGKVHSREEALEAARELGRGP